MTENLDYLASLYGLPRRQVRITEALAAVGLADRAQDLTRSLSKGLRQRAALARALLNDPAVMFLDEPTSGLDPVAAHEVHGLISGLRDRGVTVFLTAHRLDEACWQHPAALTEGMTSSEPARPAACRARPVAWASSSAVPCTGITVCGWVGICVGSPIRPTAWPTTR